MLCNTAKEFKSRAAKAIWDFHGVYASSRHIPGVRFAGVSHPGLIGTAPSQELLDTWNTREGALIAKHPGAVPAVAFPPEPVGAYVGQDLPDDVRAKVYKEGARTIPGREHGGNCDVSCICATFGRVCANGYVVGGSDADQESVGRVSVLLPGLRQGRQLVGW